MDLLNGHDVSLVYSVGETYFRVPPTLIGTEDVSHHTPTSHRRGGTQWFLSYRIRHVRVPGSCTLFGCSRVTVVPVVSRLSPLSGLPDSPLFLPLRRPWVRPGTIYFSKEKKRKKLK